MQLPDLKLLQAAIVLSDVRHYSRAAKKLGIQQPTLTKRIVELERFVGFKLFLRTTQFVEPTEACRSLVQASKEAVFHAERAIQIAKAAEKGAQTVLHLGKTQYIDPYLLSMLNAVSLPLYPNLELSLSNLLSDELEREVLLGKLDLAVTMEESHDPKITQLLLTRTPVYVLLAVGSPCANEVHLTFENLKNQRWSLYERNVHSTLHDAILAAAQDDGNAAASVHHVATAEEAARMLYEGISEAAFLTQAAAWRVARNGLTMRPLQDDRLWFDSRLIAREDNTSRIVSEFTRSFKRSLEISKRLQLKLPI